MILLQVKHVTWSTLNFAKPFLTKVSTWSVQSGYDHVKFLQTIFRKVKVTPTFNQPHDMCRVEQRKKATHHQSEKRF